MRKNIAVFVLVCLLNGTAQIVFAEEPKTDTTKPKPGIKLIVGILTEVTSASITIRTEDGKDTAYMRGLGLKLPKGVSKGTRVTIQVNERLNVVKSIEHFVPAKHRG